MIEAIGWIGSLFLSTCGLPLLIDVCIKKKVGSVSIFFLLWWLIGEILLFVYIIVQPLISLPLLFNYGFNCICVLIVIGFIVIFKNKKRIKT